MLYNENLVWYNKTHSAIIDWEADWTITDEPAYLFMEDILHLLTDDRLETVLLSDIAWKGKHNLSLIKKDLRYRHADPYIPGIVAFNAPNPYNDKYRMIDGKHRIHKLVSESVKESEFYVLDFNQLRPLFVNESERDVRQKSYR